jgi:hypothetical protein
MVGSIRSVRVTLVYLTISAGLACGFLAACPTANAASAQAGGAAPAAKQDAGAKSTTAPPSR